MAPVRQVRKIFVEPRSPKPTRPISRRPSWSLAGGRLTQLVYSFVLCTAIVAGSHLIAQDFKRSRGLQWPRYDTNSKNTMLVNLHASTQPLKQTNYSPQWPSALHNSSLILVQSLVVKLLHSSTDSSELSVDHDAEINGQNIIIAEPPVDFNVFVSNGDIVEAARRRVAKGRKAPISASKQAELRKVHSDEDQARRRLTSPLVCTASDVVWATLGRRASNAPFVPTHCRWLDLSNSDINDSRAAEVATALMHHPNQLLGLDLSRNAIGPSGAAALAVAFQQGQQHLKRDLDPKSERDETTAPILLETINLASNRLGDVGMTALASGLATPSCHLKVLIAHNNCIGNAGAAALSDALGNNLHLKTLLLTNNRIEDVGAEALSEGLKQQGAKRKLAADQNINRSWGSNRHQDLFTDKAYRNGEEEGLGLAMLGLSSNAIGDHGAVALGASLAAGSGLEELFLSWSRAPLGDMGAEAIAHGVQKALNPRLSALHLTGNQVGSVGAAALLDAFEVTPLSTIGLEQNGLPADGLRQFRKYT